MEPMTGLMLISWLVTFWFYRRYLILSKRYSVSVGALAYFTDWARNCMSASLKFKRGVDNSAGVYARLFVIATDALKGERHDLEKVFQGLQQKEKK
jgi:hypothetical protein